LVPVELATNQRPRSFPLLGNPNKKTAKTQYNSVV